MPKAVQFKDTFYSEGLPKYEAGKSYPETDETLRQIAVGSAESVNVKAVDVEPPPTDSVNPASDAVAA